MGGFIAVFGFTAFMVGFSIGQELKKRKRDKRGRFTK